MSHIILLIDVINIFAITKCLGSKLFRGLFAVLLHSDKNIK